MDLLENLWVFGSYTKLWKGDERDPARRLDMVELQM